MGECNVIYGAGMLYELLDRYAENDIDEMEHAFISSMKWPDSYVLKIYDKKFWEELQKYYGVSFTEEDKINITTVKDLKARIKDEIL